MSVLTAFFYAGTAYAATYYVAASGNNTNSGTSTTTPWQTVSKVNSAALNPGDSVLFNKGDTFSGTTLGVSTSGTSGNPITYGAYGTGVNPKITIASWGISIAASYVNINSIDVIGSSSFAYRFSGIVSNINISNTNIISSSSLGFEFYNGTSTNISITNATSTAYTNGINFECPDSVTGLTIASSSFSGAVEGINSCASLSNIQIQNSAFTGNGAAIYLSGAVSGLTVSNSQIQNNIPNGGLNGFGLDFLSGTLNNTTLTNDIVTGNGQYGINVNASGSNFTISSSTVSNNGSGGYLQGMYDSGNITNLVISSSTFSGNTGSGLDINASTSASINNSTFSSDGYNNTTTAEGLIAEGSSTVSVVNSLAYSNGDDGMDAGNNASLTINESSSTNNGYPGAGGGNGNGYSWHLTATGLIENSYAGNNLVNAVAHVASSSVAMYNNVFYSNISEILPLVYLQGVNYTFQNNTLITGSGYSIPGTVPPVILEVLSGTPAQLSNNVIYAGTTTASVIGIKADLGSIVTADYDSLFGLDGITYSGISAGAHDISTLTNPLFNNLSGGDYSLAYNSPLIDTGSTTATTSTDYYGHPRYGSSDIGAYEYQPPYTIGTNKIDIGAGARVYGDGMFRNLATTSSVLANLAVAPLGGTYPTYAASTTRPAYMDISNITWHTSGDYAKTWTASSSIATTTVFTVGDLQANSGYYVKLDGSTTGLITGSSCTAGTCTSNGSGILSFTYSGGYSVSHVFTLQQAPVVVTQSSNVSYGGGSAGGGSASPALLASLLAPSAATTAYLNSLNYSVSATAGSAQTTISANSLQSASSFSNFLQMGNTGPEVKALQIFLNGQGFIVSGSGAGSPGHETNTFGSLTKKALARFQKVHNLPATGYFGPMTKQLITQ